MAALVSCPASRKVFTSKHSCVSSAESYVPPAACDRIRAWAFVNRSKVHAAVTQGLVSDVKLSYAPCTASSPQPPVFQVGPSVRSTYRARALQNSENRIHHKSPSYTVALCVLVLYMHFPAPRYESWDEPLAARLCAIPPSSMHISTTQQQAPSGSRRAPQWTPAGGPGCRACVTMEPCPCQIPLSSKPALMQQRARLLTDADGRSRMPCPKPKP